MFGGEGDGAGFYVSGFATVFADEVVVVFVGFEFVVGMGVFEVDLSYDIFFYEGFNHSVKRGLIGSEIV